MSVTERKGKRGGERGKEKEGERERRRILCNTLFVSHVRYVNGHAKRHHETTPGHCLCMDQGLRIFWWETILVKLFDVFLLFYVNAFWSKFDVV